VEIIVLLLLRAESALVFLLTANSLVNAKQFPNLCFQIFEIRGRILFGRGIVVAERPFPPPAVFFGYPTFFRKVAVL